MKKRKFNILLNIATLCLCVCAIAFGVYSAKQASLNVSGTIGFSAHNCLVNITGNYKAYTSSNLSTRTTTTLTETNVGGSASADYNKTLNITNTLYFSDLATDNFGHEIEFELIIKNNSPFKISVKAPVPTLTTASGTAITSVTGSTSNASFTLDKEESKTITLTFTLSDVENAESIDSTSQFKIDLSFEMWKQFRVETVTEQIYNTTKSAFESVTTNRLVTTMGHSIVGTASDAGTDGLATETPIRWFAFAVKGEGDTYKKPSFVPTDNVSITTGTGEIWYSLYGVDMINVDYKGKTFWFIQEYVVAGGYFINDYNVQLGISFQFEQNNTYAQIDSAKPNNSKKSTIYTFLNDIDATDSYAKKTGITTEELNKIDSRNVDESYEVSFTGYNATTEGSKNYLACKFSSMFWLINHAELGLLCNQSVGMSYTDSKYTVKTYGINNQDGNKSGEGAQWWLRSPYPDDGGIAHCVSGDGNFTGCGAHNDWVGVRAAFQITL